MMRFEEEGKFYTIQEAAKIAGVDQSRVYSAVQRGNIICTKFSDHSARGYRNFISESALDEWIDDPYKVRNKEQRDKIKAMDRNRHRRRTDTLETGVPVDENGDSYLTVDDVAIMLGKSEYCVRAMLYNGRLVGTPRCLNGHKRIFISRASVVSYQNREIERERKMAELEKGGPYDRGFADGYAKALRDLILIIKEKQNNGS